MFLYIIVSIPGTHAHNPDASYTHIYTKTDKDKVYFNRPESKPIISVRNL